jgi:hypothetical protein
VLEVRPRVAVSEYGPDSDVVYVRSDLSFE